MSLRCDIARTRAGQEKGTRRTKIGSGLAIQHLVARGGLRHSLVTLDHFCPVRSTISDAARGENDSLGPYQWRSDNHNFV